jgi:hypothetical protein
MRLLRLNAHSCLLSHWIGLQDNLQDTPILNGKTMVSGFDFPNKTNPMIIWMNHNEQYGYLGLPQSDYHSSDPAVRW